MNLFRRLAYWVSGLGILGAMWLWVFAAISGFSSSHFVCFATGDACLSTNNPYWLSSTSLWLAPLIIILIFCSWFLPMLILPKSTPELFSVFSVLFLLCFVVFIALKLAAGNGI